MDNMPYLSFCAWRVHWRKSLVILCTLTQMTKMHSYLWLTITSSWCAWTWVGEGRQGILFIHLSVDPLVDMSWLLWISQVQICQGYAEHIGVQAECMVVLTLILWGASVPFHTLAKLTYISNNSAQTSPLSRSLTAFLKCHTSKNKMSQAFIFWFQSPC